MPPFILLIIFYFLVVAFVSGQFVRTDNPFISFYELQLGFIFNHTFLVVLLFLFLTIVFLRFGKHRKNKLNKYVCFLKKILTAFFAGSLIAFFLLFIIALVHINSLSLLSFVNPQSTGIKTEIDVILEEIKSYDDVPNVVFNEAGNGRVVKTAAAFQSGKTNYYSSCIIPIISNIFILTNNDLQRSIFIGGDTLFVNDINSDNFQKLSPVVGYLMIKDYFPKKVIRPFPQLSLVDKKDYAEFRKGNFKDKLETIDQLVMNIGKNIEELEISIKGQQSQLSEQEDNMLSERADKEKEYIRCVNEGYYQEGIYYKTNSKEFCLEQKNQREELIKGMINDIDDTKNSIIKNSQRIVNNQKYLKFYNSQKLLTQEDINFIVDEYAIFNPPDIIKITQTIQNNPQALADYFVVLIHEYLHFTTYNEEGKSLGSLFFTEGLTEYFARKITAKNLGLMTNIAYPVNVKIIEQLMKRINEEDIAEIYFANDEKSLEKLIDMVYEEGFYQDNLITLETLHHSSDAEQILNLTNEVMKKIGGETLTKEDIISDNDTFY